MDNSKCPSFEGCKAPLCPMDDFFKNGAIWFTDEDICISLKFRKEHWYKIQKRIKKLSTDYKVLGYFDHEILNGIKIVRKGIHGR
jgi:hypothetical protein